MKRLLLSTAILGAATVPALAQDQSIFREAPEATELRASDFMGMRVYASEAAVEGEEFEGLQEGWEDIGEINDIVMDRDGQVQAVLVDIGGFLGIGERTVAVSMDALQFVSDSATAEEADDFFLVMNANREALEAAPEYVDAEMEGMTAEQAATETEQAIEEGGETTAAAGAAVEGAENAEEEVVAETGEAAETVVTTTEEAGETVAEGAENAVEETGEEVAQAGQEVADEAADAGEEVSDEVAQTDMTDAQEDQAEVADATQDATEEATEETAQASAEATDEAADGAEVVAEGEAAEEGAAAEETTEVATAETETVEVTDAEQVSAEETAREPIAREGFVALGAEEMTADLLQGAAVYDANDERVGEVGEIILSAEGQVDQLVIDVGGFLGLGEKPVALPMASLDILRQDGGEEIRVYVSQTEEELEAMERYEAQ